jgi:hypothetical protein
MCARKQLEELSRMTTRIHRQCGGAAPVLLGLVVLAAILTALWFWAFLSWNYSSGERAGWVQKLSHKGWLCKTWEGEMAMVTMPGTAQEKFLFTVRDESVVRDINKAMGRRVSLSYEEKVGLPTSCFGETRHFVTRVVAVEEIPLAPGIVVGAPPLAVPPAAVAPALAPAQSSSAPDAPAASPAVPSAPAAPATPPGTAAPK